MPRWAKIVSAMVLILAVTLLIQFGGPRVNHVEVGSSPPVVSGEQGVRSEPIKSTAVPVVQASRTGQEPRPAEPAVVRDQAQKLSGNLSNQVALAIANGDGALASKVYQDIQLCRNLPQMEKSLESIRSRPGISASGIAIIGEEIRVAERKCQELTSQDRERLAELSSIALMNDIKRSSTIYIDSHPNVADYTPEIQSRVARRLAEDAKDADDKHARLAVYLHGKSLGMSDEAIKALSEGAMDDLGEAAKLMLRMQKAAGSMLPSRQ